MANNWSLTPGIRVFECPNCKETINTSVDKCPFCSAAVDPSAAQAAAEHMARVNQAFSDADYLRIMAGMMAAFFAASLLGVPLAVYGYWFLFIAIPVQAIRWRIRFGGIQASDPSFHRVKRRMMEGIGIWALCTLPIVIRMVASAASRR